MPLDPLALNLRAREQLAKEQTRAEDKTPAAHRLGIQDWLRYYYAETFSRPFTQYQSDFWDWVETIQPGQAHRPRVECHPRGTGKCLAADTRILLPDGASTTIRAVRVGQRILSYNEASKAFEADTITNKWSVGIRSCLRITTATGKQLTLTPEHRVLTLDGWREAGQLTIGAHLAACASALHSADRAAQQDETPTHPRRPLWGGEGMRGAGGGRPACLSLLRDDGSLGYTHWIQCPQCESKKAVYDDKTKQAWCLSETMTPTLSGGVIRKYCMWYWAESARPHTPPKAPSQSREQGSGDDGRAARISPLDTPLIFDPRPVGCIPQWPKDEAAVCEVTVGSGAQADCGDCSQATAPICCQAPPHTPKDPYALQWEKVIRIEEAGEFECFDVEVEWNANLVTNGLVSHNSTGAETAVVRLLAKKVKRYVLYVSATDDQAGKHLRAIKKKLENGQLLRDYPHLQPKIEKVRNKLQNWSAERLVLASGAVVECISLLGSVRGFKSEENVRVDLIVLDDIDKRQESIDVTKKKLSILAEEVLPTGNETTDVLFAQNLIHKDSVCAMVMDGRAQIISDRIPSGPYPLVKNLVYEREEIADGGSRWIITGGKPYDEAIPLSYAQHQLQLLGPDAFLRECQQEVDRVEADKDFREWNEMYHISTWPEVQAGFERLGYQLNLWNDGRIQIPLRWRVGLGLDCGTTREHPSACVVVVRPDERFALSDTLLVIGEIVLPEFPGNLLEQPEIVSPGRVSAAIRRFLDGAGIRESQIDFALMSHEQSSVRNAIMVDVPEEFQVPGLQKWKAAKGSGVPQIQQLLEIRKSQPHPFRVYPVGHPRIGQPLMGKPRLIFVTAPKQGELFVDGTGHIRVRGALDAAGFARLRYEIPIYSHRHTGKKKLDDDGVDALRGLLNRFGPDVAEKTEEERFDDRIPEHLREVNVLAMQGVYGKDPYALLLAKRRDALQEIREDVQNENKTGWEKTWGSFV